MSGTTGSTVTGTDGSTASGRNGFRHGAARNRRAPRFSSPGSAPPSCSPGLSCGDERDAGRVRGPRTGEAL